MSVSLQAMVSSIAQCPVVQQHRLELVALLELITSHHLQGGMTARHYDLPWSKDPMHTLIGADVRHLARRAWSQSYIAAPVSMTARRVAA